MFKRVLFTVLTAVALGGAGFFCIRSLLKDKGKIIERLEKLFDNGEDCENDSDN